MFSSISSQACLFILLIVIFTEKKKSKPELLSFFFCHDFGILSKIFCINKLNVAWIFYFVYLSMA